MAAGSLTIRVLGPVTASIDGRSVELGGPRQTAVLAALVMNVGSVVSPTRLIDLLWPDDPPASATKLVQKHISGLRSSLGAAAIETTGGGYRLTIDPDAIDVKRLEQAVERDEYVHAEDDALGVDWQGPAYSGCADAPFIDAERERLGHLRLEARLDWLTTRLDSGHFGPTLAELERLWHEQPDHERITALLMRGLYASDRHVDALRVCARHRRYLRNEIGVAPSPELDELERRILHHDHGLRVEPAPRPPEQAPSSDHPQSDSPQVVPFPGDDATDDGLGGVEEIRNVVLAVITEPTSGREPEEIRETQLGLADATNRLAERFGASLVRIGTDELMVVFGVPARDHDPRRATAFARAVADTRPQARVAVVAGDALVTVGPHIDLVAGGLIERARRLNLGATTGQVSIADNVAARINERHATPEATFVGRHDERRAITDVWGRVLDTRQLRVVEVVGDAGIGKTRLVREAIAVLDPPPIRVIELGYSPLGDGSLSNALREAVTKLAPDDDDVDTWLGTLDLPDRSRRHVRHELTPLLSHDPPDIGAIEGWTAAIVDLYDHLAAQGPMVVVVEDLHWGRHETVAQLHRAVTDLADRPILTVLTRRPEPSTADLAASPVAERTVLRLAPLRPDEVDQVTSDVGAALDDRAREVVTTRSGGNPLFLLQYIRMLLDRPDLAHADPPDSVRQVISTRLDHLAPPLRTIIQAASVVANRITADAVAVVAAVDPAPAVAALNVLVRSGLLFRVPHHIGDQVCYQFHHSIVADAAYRQITRARRRQLHERAATWLETSPTPTGDALDDAGWHRRRIAELGGSDASDPDRNDLKQRMRASSGQCGVATEPELQPGRPGLVRSESMAT